MVPWQSDPIAGFPSIPADMEAWGKRAGCKSGPTTISTKGKYTIQRWSECADGKHMDLVRNHRGTHEWPSDTDFDTTAYLHDFFYNSSGMPIEQQQQWVPTPKEDLPISRWRRPRDLVEELVVV
uniref:Uncharacterized protein n=1 Tax=Alexandrium andersonii TaxID=327968 RepID=A0A7S2FAY0_9DINO|mmetsp:Transcript_20873/g.47552  ORF Transcript_20873/g.47552 Transcript_20873/m.47552 type:complete len:124 (+) Transcript_20873:2-373(+)